MGGDLVAFKLQNPYPENYPATVQQVVTENKTGYLPLLKTKIDSIQNYDIVFAGFPTWGMQIPPLMKIFLHRYKNSTVNWSSQLSIDYEAYIGVDGNSA